MASSPTQIFARSIFSLANDRDRAAGAGARDTAPALTQSERQRLSVATAISHCGRGSKRRRRTRPPLRYSRRAGIAPTGKLSQTRNIRPTSKQKTCPPVSFG